MTRSQLALAVALATSGCQPVPHVIVELEDPYALTAGATAIGVGASLGEIEVTDLDGGSFPETLTLYGPQQDAERTLCIEALDADGAALARGWVAVVFSSETRTEPVELSYACEREEAAGQVCTLAQAPAQAGVCRAAECSPRVDAFSSWVTLAPDSAVADGEATVVVSAELRDVWDNAASFVEVQFAASGAGLSLDEARVFADADGRASFELSSTAAGVVVIEVRVDPDGDDLALSERGYATFVAGPADPDRSQVVAAPAVIANDGVDASVITVTARDRFDNPVASLSAVLTSDPPLSCAAAVCLGQPSNATGAGGDTSGWAVSTLAGSHVISAVLRQPGADDLALTATANLEVVVDRARVASAAIVSQARSGCLPVELTAWDLRERPVLPELWLGQDAGGATTWTPATLSFGPRSAGYAGGGLLSTSAVEPGRTHRLFWDTDQVPLGTAWQGALRLNVAHPGEPEGSEPMLIPDVVVDRREVWSLVETSTHTALIAGVATPTASALVAGDLHLDGALAPQLVFLSGGLLLVAGRASRDDVAFPLERLVGDPSTQFADVTLGDADRDGWDEVIAVWNELDRGYLGFFPSLDEALAPGPSGVDLGPRRALAVAAAELDGDGDLDVVVALVEVASPFAPSVAFCAGAGGGFAAGCELWDLPAPAVDLDAFGARRPVTTPSHVYARLGQVIAVSADGQLTRFTRDSAAAAWSTDALDLAPPGTITALAHGSLGNDDVVDLVVATVEGDVCVITEGEPGSLAAQPWLAASSAIRGLAVIDLDRDGADDLVFADPVAQKVGALFAQPGVAQPAANGAVPAPAAIAFRAESLGNAGAAELIWVGDLTGSRGPEIVTAGVRDGGLGAELSTSVFARELPAACNPAAPAPRILPLDHPVARIGLTEAGGEGWDDLFAISSDHQALEYHRGSGRGFSFIDRVEPGSAIVAMDWGFVDADAVPDAAIALADGRVLFYRVDAGRLVEAAAPVQAVAPAALYLPDGVLGTGVDLVIADAGDGESPPQIFIYSRQPSGALALAAELERPSTAVPALLRVGWGYLGWEPSLLAVYREPGADDELVVWYGDLADGYAASDAVSFVDPVVDLRFGWNGFYETFKLFVITSEAIEVLRADTLTLFASYPFTHGTAAFVYDVLWDGEAPGGAADQVLLVGTDEPSGLTALWDPLVGCEVCTFGARHPWPLTSTPRQILPVDHDGGGILDLYVASPDRSYVELLPGADIDAPYAENMDAGGMFPAVRTVPEQDGPCGGATGPLCPTGPPAAFTLTTAAIAHPGRDDLVLLDRDGGRLRVVLNGYDDFCAVSEAATAGIGEPLAMAAGLFDGDGMTDVAVLDRQDTTVFLSIHTGVFRDDPMPYDFGAALRFEVVGAVVDERAALAAADLNGDGNTDLVLAHQDPAQPGVIVLHGDGSGAFAEASAPVIVPVPPAFGPAVAVQVVELIGGAPVEVVLTPADGDGLVVLEGALAAGRWVGEAQWIALGRRPKTARVVDLDAVGALDGVVVDADDTLRLFAGWVSGSAWVVVEVADQPLAGTSQPGALQIHDFSGDGYPDVAVLLPELGALALHAGQGPLALDAGTLLAVGEAPQGLAVGRFDSNAWPDLAILQRDGVVRILYDRHPSWPSPAGACLP